MDTLPSPPAPALPAGLPALPGGFARLNPDRTITLRLQAPFTMRLRSRTRGVFDRRFEELVFHPMNGAAIRAAARQNGHEDRLMAILAEVLRLKLNVAAHLPQSMSRADAERAMAVFAYVLLLGGGLENRPDLGEYVNIIRAAWADAHR